MSCFIKTIGNGNRFKQERSISTSLTQPFASRVSESHYADYILSTKKPSGLYTWLARWFAAFSFPAYNMGDQLPYTHTHTHTKLLQSFELYASLTALHTCEQQQRKKGLTCVHIYIYIYIYKYILFTENGRADTELRT